MIVMLLQCIGSAAAVSACTTQQNTQLAACNSTFTGCVDSAVVSMCDCVSNRIECSNGLNCTEADVRGKTWFSDCETDGLCSCPTTRVEKLCVAIVDTAQETYVNCTLGAIPNATYCDCVTTFNQTLLANVGACNNSNTNFPNKIAEVSLYGDLYCTADAVGGCTPYQTKGVLKWSEDLTNCTNLYVNGSVTRVGPYCQCMRSVRNNLPPNIGSRTCLISLDAALDTIDALYDCEANINTTAICDTDKYDACTANKTTCMSVAAGNIASACSCYASFSKCLTSNIACPGSQLAQAGVHLACKATCPVTTDCGPEGKTFTIATTTPFPDEGSTKSPSGTASDGSPVTGGDSNGGTNSDGSPATGGTGKTNSDGSPITADTRGAASQIIVGAAALLVAVLALLLN